VQSPSILALRGNLADGSVETCVCRMTPRFTA
jgi:hypothetical protein